MGKLRVFESFSGIGSQSIALRNINCDYDVVGISEVDKNALIAYDAIHNKQYIVPTTDKSTMLREIKNKNIAYNFSTGKSEIPKNENDIKKIYDAHIRSKNFGDIRLINPETLPDFDLFTYSFPCKNISIAGQQAGANEGSGTQSSLIWECEKIIKHKKPKYLLMENVKNLIGKKHKPVLDMWCDVLDGLGYVNILPEKGYINGKDFGVPQNRERVIMISIRKDIQSDFKFPKGFNNEVRLYDILEKSVEDKLIIPIEQLITNDDILYSNYRIENEEKKPLKLIQVGMLNIKGNESNRRVYLDKGLCPTLNSMNGGNRQPKILISKTYDDGIYNIMEEKALGDNFILRKLTPLECWRVMGLSDTDFYKAKDAGLSNSKLYERAGRAIVVPMLEEIFKVLLEDYLRRDSYEEYNM